MRNLIYTTVFFTLVTNPCLAQNKFGEILDDEVAVDADISALEAEAQAMNTIKKGIALSLAMCEGIELCAPNVNRDELERFINSINLRIGSLGTRLEESGNKEIEPILLAYADARESYSEYLDKLGTMVVEEEPATDDLFGRDDFFRSIRPRATNTLRQFDSLFNDADEELTDDVEVEEELPIETETEAAGPE